MSLSKTARLVGATVTVAALAAPAVAPAHPSIFEVQAKVVRTGAPTPPTTADLITQRQYTVLNDGYVIALRESNGVTDTVHPAVPANGFQPAEPATLAGGGMTNFKFLPGTVRANTAEFPDKSSWLAYGPSRSDVQAHATCLNVPALSSTANILAWQGDPFYNYIPWQKTSAGIADDPGKWLPVVKTATGVDLSALSTVGEFTAACTGLGGTYAPADIVVTSPTSAASASIADAVKPVSDAKLVAENAAAAATAAAMAANQRAAAAEAENTRLQLAATPLRLTLTAPPTLTKLTSTGVPVSVTSGPLQSVTVRLLTTASKAKALKLKSRILGTATTTTTAAGTATLSVTVTPVAATAIKGTKALALTVEALAAQRTTALTSIVKR